MHLNKAAQRTGTVITFFTLVLLGIYMGLSMVNIGNPTQVITVLSIIFLIALSLCIFLTRKYRNNRTMIDYLNIGTQRYLLGLFMVFYGVSKLFGHFFDYQLYALDSKLIDASDFQLAWYFYGKKHSMELFSGIMEFFPALFLLRRKTYYVAALVLLPVTAQVFILNLFFKIGGITLPAATILLCCNVYIIYSQIDKIKAFFQALNFNYQVTLSTTSKNSIRVLKGIAMLLIAFLIFNQVKPLLFKSEHQKIYQPLVGMYTLQEMKRNHMPYSPTTDSNYYKDIYIEKQDRWNMLRRFDNNVDAFILNLNNHNDSFSLYINKGGAGDDPDIIDSATVLKGVYKLDGNYLTIKGIQQSDTLDLKYKKQEHIQPKTWFW
jgi:hypothetical protein